MHIKRKTTRQRLRKMNRKKRNTHKVRVYGKVLQIALYLAQGVI